MLGGRGLCAALIELSRTGALHELAGRAGYGAPWEPGRPLGQAEWTRRPWGQGACLGRAEWEAISIEGMETRWSAQQGHRKELDWREGGWLWSIDDGCWMMQTFVICFPKEESPAGSKPHKVDKILLQPAALTFWQWDNDPLNDNYRGTLGGKDLEAMAQGMTCRGLDALLEGLSGSYAAPGDCLARLRALRERAWLLESVDDPMGESQGSKRL
jgi:hypothetical protein